MPDDVEGFERTARVVAGADRHRRSAHAAASRFSRSSTARAVDIIQPDLTKCGGLSEGRKLAWMAYDHGVLLVPHGWNTAVGVAADLALSAAMPVARWVEYQTGVPYIEEMIDRPASSSTPTACCSVPTGPGPGHRAEPRRTREVRAPLSSATPERGRDLAFCPARGTVLRL